MSGLERHFLGAMERGTRNASLETLFEVAKALKVEALSLIPQGMPAGRR